MTSPLCIGTVFDVLFNHGVHYTISEYPRLEQSRLLLVKILLIERKLSASEAMTEVLTNELLTLERRLQSALTGEIVIQGGRRHSLLGQWFPRQPWTSLKWLWPCSAASMTIRQTFRFIIAGCSWRLAAARNVVTTIWRKS